MKSSANYSVFCIIWEWIMHHQRPGMDGIEMGARKTANGDRDFSRA